MVGALAALPAGASADLTISSATLNGATSLQSPPGGVMTARVRGNATGNDSWRRTQYRFGSDGECVDEGGGSGSGDVSFNVTAPGDPGDYNAGFTAWGSENCSPPAASSPEKVLTNALRVLDPADNPDLPPRCGINVMLVLDESGSIGDTPGAEAGVKDATRAFLSALSGTGSKVSIIDFSTSAQLQVDYTTVTAGSIANVFNPYIDDRYDPNGWTNWQDAFAEVKKANTGDTLADLVVFVTDGDPTARNTSSGVKTNITPGAIEALEPAFKEADLVKQQGSHVFALGVGSAVTKPTSARRLTAVSGFDQFPGTSFERADYTLVEDFDNLAKALRQVAMALCKASVSVTKVVDEGDGVYRPDPGWEFTADVSTSPGGFKWVQPPSDSDEPQSKITGDDGVATFQWKPDNPQATSTVTISETVKPGYEFVDWVCEKNAPGRTTRVITRGAAGGPPVGTGTLGPNEYAKCTVRNRIKPGPTTGVIEIEKVADPQSSQEFPFSGSLGDFTLIDDETDGTESSRTFPDLAPGTYTVSELVPENWQLEDVTCTPASAATITGADVSINLVAGGSVVCTYSNRRDDEPPEPPVPPEPPTPPGPPAPPTDPVEPTIEPPPPPEPAPSARLRVVKTAPRVARVGQRVPFRLTVTNTGSIAAQNVQVADVPPAAMALAGLQARYQPHRVKGNAIWRVRNLPPGESRTVRGSVRIKAGTPGLKRNLVLATAVNANLARDHTDTRLRARGAQRRGGVTG